MATTVQRRYSKKAPCPLPFLLTGDPMAVGSTGTEGTYSILSPSWQPRTALGDGGSWLLLGHEAINANTGHRVPLHPRDDSAIVRLSMCGISVAMDPMSLATATASPIGMQLNWAPSGCHLVDAAEPVWSLLGGRLVVEHQEILDVSTDPPASIACSALQDGAEKTWTLAVGEQLLVQSTPSTHTRAPMEHWEIVVEARCGRQWEASRFDQPLFSIRSRHCLEVVWHPTFKSSAIYAVAQRFSKTAVHLVDAKRHTRWMTWTYQQLAGMVQSSDGPGALSSLAWSLDGLKLSIILQRGMVILSFQDKAPCA
ncbi:hypothetical protein WJX84_001090 [Apatococcus fuscideae]|uniref:Uncharacterized protein n=1 Tax=Apatococcus fuscideae TaxID=2026836 RepID=A0AAW1T741_9CHLO